MTTTYNKESQTSINTMMQAIDEHLSQWQAGIDRLKVEIKHFKQEVQVKYDEEIADLQEHLRHLQVRLQAMIEGEPEEWYKGRSELQTRLVDFREVFLQTAQRIRDEDETVPLGWLQGFSDERTHESEGWVEGMGTASTGSEGWVEGMGQQDDSSKGWLEGYDKS